MRSAPTDAELSQFRRRILKWFALNGRSFPWRSPRAGTYVRVVSEILLQRTQATRIAAFIPKFVSIYPSWKQLAKSTRRDLRRLLEPLGLWRRRADALQALARAIHRQHGRLPGTPFKILNLPGVGQYIGNAILLFAHGVPSPLLDVNMARVLERNFGPRKLVDIRYDPYLQSLASRVIVSDKPREVNWAILDLAAIVCTPRNPKCFQCPLISTCKFSKARRKAERRET